MSEDRRRYRLYDLVVDSDSPLALSESSADSDSGDRQIWRYEEGDVEPPTGRCVHDVLDFDGQRRLEVWVDAARGIIFSHGDTRIEWNSASRQVRMQIGDDITTRPGIILERVVAPIALILEREHHIALHASAVGDGDQNAWIFVGNSGAGKSTTALELMRRGMQILADDLVMIDGMTGRLMSAMPSLRLFDRPDEVPEAIDGEMVMPEIEKFWYQLPERDGEAPNPRVRAIFLLSPDPEADEVRLEEIRGREATVGVIAQSFDLTEAVDDWRAARFRTLCKLAREIPVYRVIYARDRRDSPRQVEAVADHLRRQGGL